MLFLIEYDRARGKLIRVEPFPDFERKKLERSRLELELELNRLGKDHEVVVLEAASEAALRRTHRRYFENLDELVKAS